MRERDLSVEIFGERFQVDIGGVNVIVDIVESIPRDVAVADHHGSQAVLFGSPADVHDVFAPNGGLVVGEGDGRTAVMQRELWQVFGRNMSGTHLIAAGFGDIPILAKEAAHIAAGGAHGKDFGTGQEVV